MSATIWAPLPMGTIASIWNPGGPVTDDGGGGEVCELAEQDPLFYENFNNCIFLENFSAANGTPVTDLFPTFGGIDTWYPTSSAEGSAVVIQGAASADQINFIQGAETYYVTPASGTVQCCANIGIFSQLFCTGMIRFYSATFEGESTQFAMEFEGNGTTITMQIRMQNNFGDTHNSTFIAIPYCEWVNVEVVPGSNTVDVYVNGVSVYSSFSTGLVWRYAPNNGMIQFNSFGEEINAFRIAAIYINNPFV